MASPDWETYPMNVDCFVPLSEHPQDYRARLAEISTMLFTSGQDQLEMMRAGEDGGNVQTRTIANVEGLTNEMAYVLSKRRMFPERLKIVQSLIKQQFTFGPLLISQEAFQRILTENRVFAPFINVVADFASKVEENNHVDSCYQARISPRSNLSSHAPDNVYEICYKIKHVERNGRDRGDRWSVRQVGVYQKYSFESGRSVWIFARLPSFLRARLQQSLEESPGQNKNPMKFHVILISVVGRDWAEYIEDISLQLADLAEKACFSRVTRHHRHDYAVTFEDCQRLQLLHNKASKAATVLRHCSEVAENCKHHCRRLARLQKTSCQQEALEEIELHMRRLRSVKRSINNVLQRSRGTAILLSKILECRSGQSIHETGQGMQSNLLIIRATVSDSHRENTTIAEIAKEGRKYSEKLKALTIIATMYLPASLVATVFSSTLIQWEAADTNADGPGGSHYTVTSQFWIYIVSSLVLMILTLVSVRLLETGSWIGRRHR